MKYLLALTFLFYCGCSSAPEREKPTWVDGPTRIVDNGYVVYIGTGEEISDNQAQLAAEGLAIQDLANECSFIPKGTRVEDRYSEKQKNTYKAYAKIAIEVSVCDEAAKLTDPNDIKNMANQPFTEELKKYEDSLQDNRDEVVDAEIPAEGSPEGGGISSSNHYFMARQYVVYQNQAVILAPAGYYAAGSPAYVTYTTNVRPVIMHVQTYAAQNPQIKASPATWSTVARQVRSEHPQSFRQANGGARSVRPPPGRGNYGRGRPRPNYPQGGGKGYGRRRRGYGEGY